MARHRINLLIVALASIAVLAATVRLFTGYFERRPTPEELRVYGAFLSHMAAEAHLPQSNFALAGTTLELSDPQYVSWIPTELRSDQTRPSTGFAAFCGSCARNFVRKNMATWHLEPDLQNDAFGISVVEPPEPTQRSPRQIVWVTRVGFNLWHTRAVLSYSTSCSERKPVHRAGSGVYLLKDNGVWKVDHDQAFTLVTCNW
jgi:hypothetical protein